MRHVLGMNQEHPCLGGASLLQHCLSAALLSVVRAWCAVAGVVPQPGLSSLVMPLD